MGLSFIMQWGCYNAMELSQCNGVVIYNEMKFSLTKQDTSKSIQSTPHSQHNSLPIHPTKRIDSSNPNTSPHLLKRDRRSDLSLQQTRHDTRILPRCHTHLICLWVDKSAEPAKSQQGGHSRCRRRHGAHVHRQRLRFLVDAALLSVLRAVLLHDRHGFAVLFLLQRGF